MKNKPYDKKNSIGSLGSDLTTCIQNFHYAGEEIEKTDDEKINKDQGNTKDINISSSKIIKQ
ncbi:hypothetical protein DIC82_15125 [Clostridium beijerinckii]|nr:hypothetical protein DIC82_15125 [Clostridium beijerinckii]